MKTALFDLRLAVLVMATASAPICADERKAPPAPVAAATPASATATAAARLSAPGGYEILYAANGRVLGTNLEYSASYGRRIVFKETTSSQRFTFDVDQIDPGVLAELGINATEQKAIQARQNEVWNRAEAASLQAQAERRRAEAWRAVWSRTIVIVR